MKADLDFMGGAGLGAADDLDFMFIGATPEPPRPFELRLGDCVEVMRTMADASVDAIVTDPPYHLTTNKKGGTGPASFNLNSPAGRARISTGFMGQAWDGGDIAQSVELWAEALRVLRPGGHLLAFSHARTYHRMVCAVEDSGFEIRDQIQWIYGSGFPKSKDAGGGWGTALKPAHEPIVLARKPLVGTVADNVLSHGTGALNIDGCRVEGAYDEGRWPANVIHDGSDEVVEAFPRAKGAVSNSRSKGKNAVYGSQNASPKSAGRGDDGSAARFFYCAKASKADRDAGLVGPEKPVVTFQTANGTSGVASSMSAGRQTAYKNNHPTVKPTALMRYLCRLVTPPGGLVLDPFTGSGSTGRGAILEGFRFLGIEQDEAYCGIAHERIRNAIAEKWASEQ